MKTISIICIKASAALVLIAVLALVTNSFAQSVHRTGGTMPEQYICSSSPSATYSVSTNGITGISGYSWQISGGTITGSTTGQSVNVTWTTGGSVTAQIFLNGAMYPSYSPSLSVSMIGAPSISINGPSLVCSASPTGNFTSSITYGVGNLSYQWYRNGSPISGATSSTMSTSLSQGDNITLNVSSDGWCGSNPTTSNTYTANITTSVTPSVSISTSTPGACTGQTITFTPTVSNAGIGSATYDWKLAGVSMSGQSTYSPSVTTDTNMPNAYSPGDQVSVTVSNLTGTCLTATAVGANAPTVSIYPLPGPPTGITSAARCGPGSVTLSATIGSNGDRLKWYTGGGSYVILTGSYTTPSLSTTTSYPVATYSTASGCENIGSSAVATINPIPGLPSASGLNNTCGPGIATLNATPGTNGNSVRWYIGSGGSAPTATSLTQATTPSISATTSFAMTTYNTTTTCESAQTAIVATVSPIPSTPSLTSGYNYGTGAVTLAATTTSNTVNWYGAASGGSILAAGLNFTTPSISQTTTYYATSLNTSTTCESPRVGVNAVIKRLNAIITQSVQVSGVTTGTAVDALPIGNVIRNTTYFDGLGRSLESVDWMASPLQKDLNTPMTYDIVGRESRKYLPFASQQTGNFKPQEEIVDQSTGNYTGIAALFYSTAGDNIADDTRPFAETRYEPSPLNRSAKQGAAGLTWQPDATNTYSSTDHTIKKSYELNTSTESVVQWSYGYSYGNGTYPFGKVTTGTPGAPAYYADGKLTKSRTKDEQGNEVIEYVNTDGKTILKRVQAVSNPSAINDTNYASTYYIYDDFLNLVCVIPPEATRRLSTEYYQSGATDATQRDFLIRWAFRYRYDQRQRMILKQVPGADSVRMVYDKLDRLVFTQDGNQRPANKWSYTEYDVLNRPIINGLYTHTSALTQTGMTSLVSALTTNYETYNGTAATHGYTTNVFPTATFPAANFEPLTITYYDAYSFKTMIGGTTYDFVPNDYTDQYNVGGNPNLNLKGQAVGTKVKVLDQPSPTYLWAATYFDDKYRVIQTIATSAKGGVDRTTNVFDFPGKVLKTMTTHTIGAVTHVVARHFEYDHVGRMTRIWHKVDAQPDVILVQNEYNELGQLAKKKLHAQVDPAINLASTTYSPGTLSLTSYTGQTLAIATTTVSLDPGFDSGTGATFTARTEYTATNLPPGGAVYNFAQVIDYRYNIRGWLSKINNSDLTPGSSGDPKDYFGMELGYDGDIGTGASTVFNGNISAVTWSSSVGMATVKQRAYNYSYDPMNRITAAAQKEKASGWAATSNFSESGYTYDMNGNIKGLTRNGNTGANIDVLTYDYGTTASNQLLKVSDTADKTKGFIEPTSTTGNDYTYDANGSMTTDQNKGISAIVYNHLNLPKQVTKISNDYLKYIYDASGRKIRQEVYNPANALTKKTDYDGEYIYENDTLKFINTEEGRVVMTGANPEYQYYLKDHLGNVRTTFTTRASKDVYTATFENATQTTEQAVFRNYSRVTNDLFDHTDAGTTYDKAQLLNGGNGLQVGLAKSLSVMAGDTVQVDVYAKYFGTTGGTSNLPAFATALLSAFGLSAPVGGETGTARAALNNIGAAVAGGTIPQNNNSWPEGWLNVLVFDKDYNLVDFKYQQIDAAYVQTGATKMPHQLLTKTVYVKEAGYVYLYVSNEGSVQQDIYFDDMTVTHRKSPIIQQEDYYPFGLAFNEYQRQNSTVNNYQYNGKEKQDELNVGWLDYGARMYMPEVGRWGVVDPLADMSRRWSTYSYAYDNPLRFIDPDGMFATSGMEENEAANFQGPKFDITDTRTEEEKQRYNSADEAAEAWGKKYNDNSIEENREFASTIYSFEEEGNTYYAYTKPRKGSATSSHRSRSGIGRKDVGDIHSHGAWDGEPRNLFFSPDDLNDLDKKKGKDWAGYLTTPDGVLWKYNPDSGKDSQISIEMPSDQNYDGSKNSIDSRMGPKDEPVFNLFDWIDLIYPPAARPIHLKR